MSLSRLATRADLFLGMALQVAIILGGIYLIARYVIEPALIPVAIIIPGGGKAAAPVRPPAKPVIDVRGCPEVEHAL